MPISPGPLQSALFIICTDTAYKYRMVQFGLAWIKSKLIDEFKMAAAELMYQEVKGGIPYSEVLATNSVIPEVRQCGM